MCFPYHHKIFPALLLAVVCCPFWGIAENNAELLFCDAVYQEEVIGDIGKAIDAYQALLQQPLVDQELKARIHLRLAFCHEKNGNFATAEQIYGQMLSEYGDMPTVTRMVHAQMREQLRRKQIKELKLQLQTLAEFSPALRAQLEEEVKKLQEKIQTLEKMKPGDSGKSEVPDVKESTSAKPRELSRSNENGRSAVENGKNSNENGNEQQRMSEILSLHLYHVARNLYSQGFFVSARENLRKALSFHPQNQQASELLKDVEAMLSHRDMPSLVHKAPDQIANKNEATLTKLAESASLKEVKNETTMVEATYAVDGILKAWNLEATKIQETGWVEAFTRLIKSQASEHNWLFPAILRYDNGKFLIKQSPLIQERIKNLWSALPEAKEVITLEANLLSLPLAHVEMLWRQPKTVFYLAEGGVSYTCLTDDQQQKIVEMIHQDPGHMAHRFPENFLLTDQKVNWKFWQEIPMVQGYQGKNLNFRFYAEGIQLLCQRDSKAKQMEITVSAQKVERPVDVVFTPQGPVEHPYIMTQQCSLVISSEREQYVLLRGVLNPLRRHTEENQELVVAIHLTTSSWADFVRTKAVPEIPRELQSKDYSLRYYDIRPWQNFSDSQEESKRWGNENNRHFLQRFLAEACKGQQVPVAPQIMDNQMVVYGTPALHQTVDNFVQSLKNNQDAMCSLSVYLISLERYTLQQLLKKWQLPPSKESAFRLHTLPMQKEELMQQLQAVENIKFHHTLGPILIGNTQKVVLRDGETHSYMEGFERQENGLLQSKIADIHEGVCVEVRPLITSEQSGTCELAVAIHQTKGSREITYAATPQVNISCKVPEMQIQKGYLYMPLQNGNSYLIAGFQYGEMAPSRDFMFLLIPNIFKNKEEVAPVPTGKN